MRVGIGNIGMGEYMAASFPIPQNPVMTGLTGLGDYVAAYFPIPQMPVSLSTNKIGEEELNGLSGCGGAGVGCGGGCGLGDCSCSSCRANSRRFGITGMSGFTDTLSGAWDSVSGSFSGIVDQAKEFANREIYGVPYWGVGLAAAAALMLMSRGGSSSRSAYRRELAEAKRRVRAKYPTYAGRVRRAVQGF